MALSCRIFSLGHLLIDYALGAAIRIVHGDRDGHRGRRSRRRAAVAIVRLVRRLLRRENNSSRQTPGAEGAPAPTDASDAGSLKANRPQSAVRAAEAAAMVD